MYKKIEDLQPQTALRGILPDAVVTVVSVQCHGSDALTLIYRGPAGGVAEAARRGGDVPLPGRPARLVRDAAHRDQARRGSRGAAEARSRQGGPGAGRQPSGRPQEERGLLAHPSQNTLVFLAADKVRLQDLDEALRKFLAWESILAEKETLNLDPHQARQAEMRKQAADCRGSWGRRSWRTRSATACVC